MKTKMRIVALVLVLAVALTGAGYAAWGNTITANTTLNTGEWEVILETDVTGHSLVAGDQVDFFENYKYDEFQAGVVPVRSDKENELGSGPNDKVQGPLVYDNEDPTYASGAYKSNPDNNYVYTIEPKFDKTKPYEVGFNFYNLHPGTKAITTYEIRNNGTIPAKVQDVKVTVYARNEEDGKYYLYNSTTADDNAVELYDAMKVTGHISKHYDGKPGESNPDAQFPNESDETAVGTPEDIDTTLAELEDTLEGILVNDGFELLPENAPGIVDSDEMEVNNFTFEIPINALNGEEGESSALKVTVEYDFVQYNVLVQDAPGN